MLMSQRDVSETTRQQRCARLLGCKPTAERLDRPRAEFISRSDVNEDQRVDKAAALRAAAGL